MPEKIEELTIRVTWVNGSRDHVQVTLKSPNMDVPTTVVAGRSLNDVFKEVARFFGQRVDVVGDNAQAIVFTEKRT